MKHTHTYVVEGMHCASCKILIEETAKQQPQISEATVSLANNTLIVQTAKGNLDVEAINQELAPLGYKVDHNYQTQPPLIQINSDGVISFNKQKLKKILVNLSLLTLILIGVWGIERTGLGQGIVLNQTDLWQFILAGLIASISTCAALIGSLLVGLSKQWHEEFILDKTPQRKVFSHLSFHLGRISGFAIGGAILGLVGQLFSSYLSSFTQIIIDPAIILTWLVIFVSIYIALIGAQMIGWNWALQIKLNPFQTQKLNRGKNANYFGAFNIGAGTFLLPCGITLLVQTAALASQNWFSGMLITLLFSLGTLPVLIGISVGGLAFTLKPKLSQTLNFVLGSLIIILALFSINSQLNILNLPNLSDFSSPFTPTISAGNPEIDASGNQVLRIAGKGFEYTSQGSTTIKTGQPTKLIFDNQGVVGCAVAMAGTGLFPGYKVLNQGENIVEFIAPAPGRYRITCTMGMVKPIFISVI